MCYLVNSQGNSKWYVGNIYGNRNIYNNDNFHLLWTAFVQNDWLK